MLTDAAVVRRVLAGDADAYAILVDRYYDRYARFAVHMLGNPQDAEEALQDAFLRAYRALEQYEERERFGGWLLRILVNQCRSFAEAQRRRESRFPDVDPDRLDLALEAPDEAEERRDQLARALAQLPPEQREAIVLRFTEDLTYEQMAELTGSGVSAVKMRVSRALDRLRLLLREVSCV